MATPSIVIVQSFTYREVAEEFSNRYHFSGAEPSDDAGWKDLADALIDTLRPIVDANVTFVRAYGYHQDGDPSVAQIDYTHPGNTVLAGSGTFSSNRAPGDAAMTCRWDTGRLNSRNKKIYLRKYFHGVFIQSSHNDKVDATQLAALETFADDVVTDLGDGVHALAGPDGAAVVAGDANQFVTTRTLKRRGKRPNS